MALWVDFLWPAFAFAALTSGESAGLAVAGGGASSVVAVLAGGGAVPSVGIGLTPAGGSCCDTATEARARKTAGTARRFMLSRSQPTLNHLPPRPRPPP